MAKPGSDNDDLQLSVRLSTTPERKLKITIANHDSREPRTFLSWDTPFDSRALDMGILTLKDAASGKRLPSPGLKVNRKLPPPRDDLVEVAAGGHVSKEIELKAPWLPRDGRKVQVAAEGEWKAVWKKSSDAVKDNELAEFGGEAAIRGEFCSDGSVDMQF